MSSSSSSSSRARSSNTAVGRDLEISQENLQVIVSSVVPPSNNSNNITRMKSICTYWISYVQDINRDRHARGLDELKCEYLRFEKK